MPRRNLPDSLILLGATVKFTENEDVRINVYYTQNAFDLSHEYIEAILLKIDSRRIFLMFQITFDSGVKSH
jgi:hypothetical protein